MNRTAIMAGVLAMLVSASTAANPGDGNQRRLDRRYDRVGADLEMAPEVDPSSRFDPRAGCLLR